MQKHRFSSKAAVLGPSLPGAVGIGATPEGCCGPGPESKPDKVERDPAASHPVEFAACLPFECRYSRIKAVSEGVQRHRASRPCRGCRASKGVDGNSALGAPKSPQVHPRVRVVAEGWSKSTAHPLRREHRAQAIREPSCASKDNRDTPCCPRSRHAKGLPDLLLSMQKRDYRFSSKALLPRLSIDGKPFGWVTVPPSATGSPVRPVGEHGLRPAISMPAGSTPSTRSARTSPTPLVARRSIGSRS
jgi:hypothetical protein